MLRYYFQSTPTEMCFVQTHTHTHAHIFFRTRNCTSSSTGIYASQITLYPLSRNVLHYIISTFTLHNTVLKTQPRTLKSFISFNSLRSSMKPFFLRFSYPKLKIRETHFPCDPNSTRIFSKKQQT